MNLFGFIFLFIIELIVKVLPNNEFRNIVYNKPIFRYGSIYYLTIDLLSDKTWRFKFDDIEIVSNSLVKGTYNLLYKV